MEKIPFNKPFLTGDETKYIEQAVKNGKLSGNGEFTQRCQKWYRERYGFKKTLLTTSCTDALEMCAMLADIKPGDEVIVKVVEIDQQGRINLSRKDALADIEAKQKRNG